MLIDSELLRAYKTKGGVYSDMKKFVLWGIGIISGILIIILMQNLI